MMETTVTTTIEELSDLVNLHLGELRQEDPPWDLRDSPISGRGIFARRAIECGEEIFREHTLLVGPTARRDSKLNTCVLCYRLLDGPIDQVLCASGCGLPTCAECSKSPRHEMECEVFRKWKPKDLTQINSRALRILPVMRCLFLNEKQRKLLYAMQANADKYYIVEVKKAAGCFECFPKEPGTLEYICRTVCAFNTNAFEGHGKVDGNSIRMRALFPLAGLMNHECTPNASHHFENAETIVVTATRAIAEGEEISTTYTKTLWSTPTRKLFLAVTKYFNCQCARCADPTTRAIPWQMNRLNKLLGT